MIRNGIDLPMLPDYGVFADFWIPVGIHACSLPVLDEALFKNCLCIVTVWSYIGTKSNLWPLLTSTTVASLQSYDQKSGILQLVVICDNLNWLLTSRANGEAGSKGCSHNSPLCFNEKLGNDLSLSQLHDRSLSDHDTLNDGIASPNYGC